MFAALCSANFNRETSWKIFCNLHKVSVFYFFSCESHEDVTSWESTMWWIRAVDFRHRRREWERSFADDSIPRRSLAICTTTKEMSSILLGNECGTDSGLSCVHSADPPPSVAVKVTASWRQKQQNLSPCLGDERAMLLVPITDHLLAD